MGTTAKIKASILSILLFTETLLITNLISQYVQSQNYFSVQKELAISIVLYMLAILITSSLTIGVWNKWEQYVVVPIPVALAILVSLLKYNTYHALIISSIVLLIIASGMYESSKIQQMLISVSPNIIFRPLNKRLLLIVSLLGGILIILGTTYTPIEINFGKQISRFAEEPLKQIAQIPQKDLDLKNMIEAQVNTLIEPYTKYFTLLIAVIVFGAFQLLSAIIYILYTFIIGPIFLVAKKTKFLKSEVIQVDKEVLRL